MTNDSYSLAELHDRVDEWKGELQQAGYPASTIATYIGRTQMFLRYLSGDWPPTGPR